MKNWKKNSWRKYPVKHIPEYPDKKELDKVYKLLFRKGYSLDDIKMSMNDYNHDVNGS